MLKKTRTVLAALMFTGIVVLFLDWTGLLSPYLGWIPKIQALEAVLALNAAVIVGLVLLTLLFGRVYCSVICPLGILQDIFSGLGGKRRKYRFGYRKANSLLRYGALAAFVAMFLLGLNSIACLIAPYAAFGRIIGAGRAASLPVAAIALVTLAVIFILAWRGGRTWCNSICPVGTVLGLLSRFAIFRPVIDTSKCNGCTLCARGCKASCINPKEHKIDYSRCVACMDCLSNCRQGAISYKPYFHTMKKKTDDAADQSRRNFLVTGAALLSAATIRAKADNVKTGAAVLEGRKAPARETPVKPAGSLSIRNFADHCVSCQLCVNKCPNHVLQPSTRLTSLLQPEMSFEKGFCDVNCNTCSSVCPAGAIKPISLEAKSSTRVGHAVVITDNCVMKNGGTCLECAKHCPAGAIRPVALEAGSSIKVPSVNTDRCIGCGSCEYHCPSKPYTAIYIEGNEIHSIA